MSRYRASVAAVAVLATLTTGACSGSNAGPTTTSSSSSAASAVRWWSGSDYCGILRQTVAAKHSIFAGADANDPRLASSTEAFVAALQHSAPSVVATAWSSLGPALVELVRSGGAPTAIRELGSARVRTATTVIASDAKSSCGLDLGSPSS